MYKGIKRERIRLPKGHVYGYQNYVYKGINLEVYRVLKGRVYEYQKDRVYGYQNTCIGY